MIRIESLFKKYGRRLVVDDVTFIARSGRLTGFLGTRGAQVPVRTPRESLDQPPHHDHLVTRRTPTALARGNPSAS